MDRKCQEVRVKPKKVQVEIDLSLEMDENYDNTIKDGHLRITKQTLLSQKVPLTRACAVGVLVGNKLHLNPVNAAVQLRPSMEHVIPDGSKKKNCVEATVKSEKYKSVVRFCPNLIKISLQALHVSAAGGKF